MARRLRIQYERARYHVINRENLQHDVFEMGGAIASFILTLQAAVGRFRWRFHAFVPHAWIADQLKMGTLSSARANLSKSTA